MISRTTCRIFGRSQRHEWHEPNKDSILWASFYYHYKNKLKAIKPYQIKQPKRIIDRGDKL